MSVSIKSVLNNLQRIRKLLLSFKENFEHVKKLGRGLLDSISSQKIQKSHIGVLFSRSL